jgi:hypothetical protein
MGMGAARNVLAVLLGEGADEADVVAGPRPRAAAPAAPRADDAPAADGGPTEADDAPTGEDAPTADDEPSVADEPSAAGTAAEARRRR